MLGRGKRFKRRLEDDLPSKHSPQNLEWQRRSEGFADFVKDKNNDGSKAKRLCTLKSGAQRFLESSFETFADNVSETSEHNIVEDVELISCCSSDEDKDVPKEGKTIKTSNKDHEKVTQKKKSPVDTTKRHRTPKASKLSFQRLSPSFDIPIEESDEEIGDIKSESENEEEDGRRPSTQLTDLHKQVSPYKKSQINNHSYFQDSPAICSFQRSPMGDSPNTSGLKVSDWVKAIDWQTPVKSGSQDEGELGIEPDSATKKKAKYNKGGLADKLNRLQARERTAVRIWDHKQNEDEDNTSKACLVKVMHFEVLYSLQLAHCKVVTIKHAGSQSEGSQGNSLDAEGGDWKSRVILFSKHMMEKLNIQAGTLVKIYPPWQELQLSSLEETVLLCTNYTRVVSPSSESTDSPGACFKVEFAADWCCPCSKDPTISEEDCAVKNIPFHPSSCQLHSQSSVSEEGSQAMTALHTVTGTQSPAPSVCDSLLEAIQRAGQPSLNFRALVQRCFCNVAERYSLLVEDCYGTMAVIQLDEDIRSITDCEGKLYSFAGSRVLTRTNKERNLTLFSVVEGAWSGHMAALSSQESQEDEPAPCTSSTVQCPGFCYILAPSEQSGFTMTLSKGEQPTSFRQPQFSPLEHVKQLRTEKRVSFLAYVLHKRTVRGDNPVWYVTDPSLSPDYLMVKESSNCCSISLTGSVAVFTDVYHVNGALQADCYTRIRSELPPFVEEPEVKELYRMLQEFTVSLPPLSRSVQSLALVSVQGEITSVDEEAAYSWEECDGCGSDKLTEDTNNTGSSTCVSCQKKVTSPVMRLKMEVYIRCADVTPDTRIKVDLQQSTVEKLLPQDSEEEEGYDIDSVLKKELGPLCCVVTTITRNQEPCLINLQELS